jgi:hypothetical protein
MRFYFALKLAAQKDQSEFIDQMVSDDPVLSLSMLVDRWVVERYMGTDGAEWVGVLKVVCAA